MATLTPPRAGASIEDQLSHYKAQYEQIALDLQEFQASSKELEAELEKDVEASESRERKLREQTALLEMQVDEWKTKCKQSREEANRAQNVLQKEITSLRETNRALQMKLRDIEVANDDYERQARNTTTSLEDLESKFNMATERAVLLEGEIGAGELEREKLRIETQRLRDELSDLRVESDIMSEKLRASAAAGDQSTKNRLPLYANPARPRSTCPETADGMLRAAAESNPTPVAGDTRTPPSPPLSDVTSLTQPARPSRTTGTGSQMLSGNRVPSSASASASASAQRRHSHFGAARGTETMPRSESLSQIKGLIGRMQKIEQRVKKAHQRLPATIREGDSLRISPSPSRSAPLRILASNAPTDPMPLKKDRPASIEPVPGHAPAGVNARSPRKRSGDIQMMATSSGQYAHSDRESMSAANTNEDRAELETAPSDHGTAVTEQSWDVKKPTIRSQSPSVGFGRVMATATRSDAKTESGASGGSESDGPIARRPSSRASDAFEGGSGRANGNVSRASQIAAARGSPVRISSVEGATMTSPSSRGRVSISTRWTSVGIEKAAATTPAQTNPATGQPTPSTFINATGPKQASSRRSGIGEHRASVGDTAGGTPATRGRSSSGVTAGLSVSNHTGRQAPGGSLDVSQMNEPPTTPTSKGGSVDRTANPTPTGTEGRESLNFAERQAVQKAQTQRSGRQNENKPVGARTAGAGAGIGMGIGIGIGLTPQKQRVGPGMTPGSTARKVSKQPGRHPRTMSGRITGGQVCDFDVNETF